MKPEVGSGSQYHLLFTDVNGSGLNFTHLEALGLMVGAYYILYIYTKFVVPAPIVTYVMPAGSGIDQS